MESVEIVAYYGEGYMSWPGRGRYESMSGCPSVDSSPLTDQPHWSSLTFGGHSQSNPIPDGAPWLIAATPNHDVRPDLPRFSRLRGHLGDPGFASCPDADRVFVVEEVLEAFEDKREFGYPEADYHRWQSYTDAHGRFRLGYPPGWVLSRSSDELITLRSEQWPASPVTVRVVEGGFSQTEAPGGLEEPRGEGEFWQGDSGMFATSNVPVLSGDVSYCAGGLPGGCIEVVFKHAGVDYVLRHEYPTGFDARQDTLWEFQHIAESFWIEGRPTVTPTPVANADLGDGPYWSREQAEEMALSMIPYGPWSVTDATMVTEAEALRLNRCEVRRDDPGYMWYTFPDGVWIVELTGTFEERDTVFYTYLDAETGFHICTAEQGRPVAIPGGPYPAPASSSQAAATPSP